MIILSTYFLLKKICVYRGCLFYNLKIWTYSHTDIPVIKNYYTLIFVLHQSVSLYVISSFDLLFPLQGLLLSERQLCVLLFHSSLLNTEARQQNVANNCIVGKCLNFNWRLYLYYQLKLRKLIYNKPLVWTQYSCKRVYCSHLAREVPRNHVTRHLNDYYRVHHSCWPQTRYHRFSLTFLSSLTAAFLVLFSSGVSSFLRDGADSIGAAPPAASLSRAWSCFLVRPCGGSDSLGIPSFLVSSILPLFYSRGKEIH